MAFDGLIAHATPFVGRGDEVERIARLYAKPACRLVTLLGPGGIGKTRLAIHAAERHASSFADGWRFVSCAPINSPELVPLAIADAVGLTLIGPGDPEDQVIAFLRDKSLLLVVDNYDHLTEQTAFLAKLVSVTRGMRMLVTSRERLGLAAETILHVKGLPYADGGGGGDLESYDAAVLFLHTARRVSPGLELDDVTRHSVARLCQMVEGMPLALELAASWLRTMSCDNLVQDLEERSLQVLAARRQDRPDRHASIQAAFDYTWDRLTELQQQVFKRLSVFRGYFDRKAAQEVAGATTAVLSDLIDKSLIRFDAHSGFDLHELLRQYAAQKLAEDFAELHSIQEHHSSYYANLLAGLEVQLNRGSDLDVLEVVERNLPNIQAGWQNAVERGANMQLGRYALVLSYYCGATGPYRYAHDLYDSTTTALLALPASLDRDRALARMLTHSGIFRVFVGDVPGAIQALTDSLDLLGRLADAPHQDMGFAKCFLGLALGAAGQDVEARRTMQEAIDIFESLAGNGYFGLVVSLCFLGEIALPYGDFAFARPLFERGIAVCRANNLHVAIQPALGDYVMACLGMDDVAAARACLLNEVAWESKGLGVAQLFYTLTVTALTLVKGGQPAYGVEILSAATRLPFGDWEYDIRGKPVREALDMLTERLPKDVYAAAWKRGKTPIVIPQDENQPRRLTPEFVERVTWMLVQTNLPPGSVLSAREQEVLACIERGMSNDGIAAELVISEATVKRHIHHIFGKLEVRNRTQAVARARELGLL